MHYDQRADHYFIRRAGGISIYHPEARNVSLKGAAACGSAKNLQPVSRTQIEEVAGDAELSASQHDLLWIRLPPAGARSYGHLTAEGLAQGEGRFRSCRRCWRRRCRGAARVFVCAAV
jgi:hypothetical protein